MPSHYRTEHNATRFDHFHGRLRCPRVHSLRFDHRVLNESLLTFKLIPEPTKEFRCVSPAEPLVSATSITRSCARGSRGGAPLLLWFPWICIFDGLRFYNFFSRPARNFSRFGGEFFANSFVLALGFKEKCGKVKIFCVFRVFPLSWLKEWSKNCGVAEKCDFSRFSLVLV